MRFAENDRKSTVKFCNVVAGIRRSTWNCVPIGNERDFGNRPKQTVYKRMKSRNRSTLKVLNSVSRFSRIATMGAVLFGWMPRLDCEPRRSVNAWRPSPCRVRGKIAAVQAGRINRARARRAPIPNVFHGATDILQNAVPRDQNRWKENFAEITVARVSYR